METQIDEGSRELVERASSQLDAARLCKITTNDDNHATAGYLKAIKSRTKEISDKRMEMTRPLDTAKKAIMDFFRPALDNLTEAERIIKREMLRFQQEQEAERKAEQAELQRQAEAEQKRRDNLAETQAGKAEERGDFERAEEIRDNVPIIPIQTVESQVEKVGGISTRKIWKYQIMDMDKFLNSCATDQRLQHFIVPNDKDLGSYARGAKESAEIPGVRFYPEDSISAGRG